jgi:NitT/TauT family transport system substrate-binding protein
MRRVMTAAAIGAALLLAGCSSSASSSGSTGTSNAGGSAPVTVRLGLLSNITHASALVALKEGYFTKALGSAGTLKATAFSSGTEETTAILAGQLDAAYVGPNPAIEAWQKAQNIQVISGAATGGASIVVKKGITSAAQLKGKSLQQHGLKTTQTGGGDAFIKPTKPNSAAVLQFKSGQIAGGSEPAPYDIQMIADGGTVLLNEPGVTTLLMVTKSFLSAHPAVVADLLKAQVQANALIKSNPTQAQSDANAELATYTGKPLAADLVAKSFAEITFTNDPDAASLKTDASQAVSLGLLDAVNLDGIFNLGPLNKVLAAAGDSQVSS